MITRIFSHLVDSIYRTTIDRPLRWALRTPPPDKPEANEQKPCPSRHRAAIPVDLPESGETVAWLCPDCETQLPSGFGEVLARRRAQAERRARCTHKRVMDASTLSDPNAGMCLACFEPMRLDDEGHWEPKPEGEAP